MVFGGVWRMDRAERKLAGIVAAGVAIILLANKADNTLGEAQALEEKCLGADVFVV